MQTDNGALLEPAEFLYLLETLNAVAVVGLDNTRLFPTRPAVREARRQDGLAQLKAHGWLRPAAQAGRWDMDEGLLLLAAVVAEPMVVILTVRNRSRTACTLARQYVWDNIIVELSETPEGQYRLAAVADLPATTERIARVLELPQASPMPPARLTVAEDVLDAAQRLAATEDAPAATAILEQARLAPGTAAALAQAMGAAEQGGLVTVMGVRGGKVTGSRRAMLFQSGDSAWLAMRASMQSQQFVVERSQASAVAAFISEAVSELAPAKEPVP